MNRHPAQRLTLATAAIAALAFAGCSHLPTAPAIASGNGVSDAVTVPAGATDEKITATVREQLAREVPLAEIDVQTAQGTVALSGTVEDAEAARRAVKGALAVDGVHSVRNDLKVAPEGPGRGASLAATTL